MDLINFSWLRETHESQGRMAPKYARRFINSVGFLIGIKVMDGGLLSP